MKSKKGAGGAMIMVVLVALVLLVGAGVGTFIYQSFKPTEGTGVQSTAQTEQIVTQTAIASKEGKVSALAVYVRNLAHNDQNTKAIVPVYCVDDTGNFIIDGTNSSATAEITGNTEIGKTVKCYATDVIAPSSVTPYDTLTPYVIKIEGESPHIVIDAYNISLNAQVRYYSDTLTTSTYNASGSINVSAGAGGSGTFSKIRITNNNTDSWLPLGGFYFDVVSGSNISDIDASGNAILSGLDHTSSQIVDSSLTNSVSGRRNLWDFVFEIDDDSKIAENQQVILEENDYLETGVVTVTANGDGCQAGGSETGDVINVYLFKKGYFKSTKTSSMEFGHETDANSPTRIYTDLRGDKVACVP